MGKQEVGKTGNTMSPRADLRRGVRESIVGNDYACINNSIITTLKTDRSLATDDICSVWFGISGGTWLIIFHVVLRTHSAQHSSLLFQDREVNSGATSASYLRL